MKEFKGTKGKWYIDLDESRLNEFNQLCTVISSVRENICRVVGLAEVFGDDEEARANAKLIAAALEMLEMLQKIKEINNLHNFNGHLINEQIEKLLTKIIGV